jgi:hypothetical protein
MNKSTKTRATKSTYPGPSLAVAAVYDRWFFAERRIKAAVRADKGFGYPIEYDQHMVEFDTAP